MCRVRVLNCWGEGIVKKKINKMKKYVCIPTVHVVFFITIGGVFFVYVFILKPK